jgi:predicted glycoside hydrolase/deacetylase ChbG (UPF0249 family)
MILIINADDFGMSTGVNRGIIQAHQAGVITSTSMMVRGSAVAEAAALAHGNPRLGIGLHVDLCEWEYRDEEWRLRYSVVATEDAEAVAREVGRQLDAFRLLMGCDPTHIDSHQHMHKDEPVRTVLHELTRKLGIPLRHFHPGIAYCGKFYGQSDKGYAFPDEISVESLLDILWTLPAGVTELACHPAAATDFDSTYRDERIVELESLCDPRVRAAIKKSGVELRSFRDFASGDHLRRYGPIIQHKLRVLRSYTSQAKYRSREIPTVGGKVSFFCRRAALFPRWVRHRHKMEIGQVLIPLPWFAYDAIDYLETILRPDFVGLEYGSGGSTLWFARRIARITSVEHDGKWWAYVLAEMKKQLISNVDVVLVPPITGLLATATDRPDAVAFPQLYRSGRRGFEDCDFVDYAQQIDRNPDNSLDIVIVDGRARPACLKHAISKIRPGGYLVLDDANRPRYGVALEWLKGWEENRFSGLAPFNGLREKQTSIYRKRRL